MNVELDWFEKHALGREYEWEKPPGDEKDDEATDADSTATASSGDRLP